MLLDHAQRTLVIDITRWWLAELDATFLGVVNGAFPGFQAGDYFHDLISRAQSILRELGTPLASIGETNSPTYQIAADLEPILKTIIVRHRLREADDVESRALLTGHADVLAALEKRLKPYDALMQSDWFVYAAAERPPSLGDFFTMERLEELKAGDWVAPPRVYDEKFHILQAPSNYYADMILFRDKCSIRDVSIGVVYLDIDHFKEFNKEVGETTVDRYVLPRFMRLVEASVYAHGFAYRFGGDEYAMVLPNTDRESVTKLLRDFRVRLDSLKYEAVTRKLGVTAGFCIITPECWLTNREILNRAERAKNRGKELGRGSIWTYNGPLFIERELEVAG